MGRISVPNLPPTSSHWTVRSSLNPAVAYLDSLPDAVQALVGFLKDGRGSAGKTLLLTGAGMSVDSGVRAYRGAEGSYSINKNFRPIFFHEFASSITYQKRYWCRSFIGYPPVQRALPNPGHFASAALARLGVVSGIITQNVDRLHHRPFPVIPPSSSNETSKGGVSWQTTRYNLSAPIIELHGTLKEVICLNCTQRFDRDWLQDTIGNVNAPEWKRAAEGVFEGGGPLRLNPDGDVELGNADYGSFVIPACPSCNSGPLKPSVIFFGESLPAEIRAQTDALVGSSSQLLVVGSSLATYSAFRIIKQAKEEGKRVCILNIGQTRADPILGAGDIRIEGVGRVMERWGASQVLRGATLELASAQAANDEGVFSLLRSGTFTPIQDFLKTPTTE